jgi:GNAT superfamily N-acetyltransferase
MPNGDFFGTIKIMFEQKFNRPNCWAGHIEDVVVVATYEGKGYGQLLVKYAIYLCKTHGCYKIRLSCSDHNIDFIRNHNFR